MFRYNCRMMITDAGGGERDRLDFKKNKKPLKLEISWRKITYVTL